MGNFLVKEPPEFSQELKTLESTDRAHADVFNALFGQLINNDAFLAALTRKTAEAVEEFLTSKGEPEGIASLDEAGKVPKEQIKLVAGDVGALPLFENKITLREAGWYRICQPKLGNATSFSIRFIKDWWHREGEVLALNISATEYKTGNVGHYNVHINQIISQGNGILDKVRVVASDEMNPAYIDMHYTLNEENNFYIQVDSVISNGDKAFCIELLEKEPQILETQSIHEWNYTRGGLVADSAKKDGNGNDIATTYFTNTKGDELKKFVSDGKTLVANAITAKGVPTAADAAFDTIATNISQITTGVDTTDADAREVDILTGKTAWVNGQKITGNIPIAPTHPNENSGIDLHFYGNETSGKDHNIFMMVPNGYYNNTWLGYKDPNLIPGNIKKGVTIGGGRKITGTYEGEQKGGIIEEVEKTYTVTVDNPIAYEILGNVFKNPTLKHITSGQVKRRQTISCYSTVFDKNGYYAGFDFWYIYSISKGFFGIMSRNRSVSGTDPIGVLSTTKAVWKNIKTQSLTFLSISAAGIYTNVHEDRNLTNVKIEVGNLDTSSTLAQYAPFKIESVYRIEQNF